MKRFAEHLGYALGIATVAIIIAAGLFLVVLGTLRLAGVVH